MSEKKCNCKTTRKANKLVETISGINRSSSKGLIKKNNIWKIILVDSLRLSTYLILSLLTIIFFIPSIIYIYLKGLIFKKGVSIKLPIQYIINKIN